VKKPGQRFDAFLPGAHAIDAYGAGGFRFGEMSHIGSILATPSGISAVDVADLAGLGVDAFQRLFDELSEAPKSVEFVVIGVGAKMALPPRGVVEALRSKGLRSEGMATGAALRTYNIMIGEGRHVAALLIAAP
jgi:uncharacterized protein